MPRPPLTVTRSELLAEGSDREFRELVHALLAFQARHEAIRDGHGAFIGLPGPQYTLLIAIHHLETEGDVTPRALPPLAVSRSSGTFTPCTLATLSARAPAPRCASSTAARPRKSSKLTLVTSFA